MTTETWRELTIPLDGLESEQLLKDWRWLVPVTASPLWLNAFGDWAFIAQDKTIYFLDLLEGTFNRASSSESAFSDMLQTEEGRNRWLTADWFGICNNRGLYLAHGQCYGWKIAPTLGGEFTFSNIQVFDIVVYESIMGQLHRQLKALPDGYVVSEFKLREP